MNSTPLNIIFPMCGQGNRFKSEGYRYPKPLITIAGRTMLGWLLDNLKFIPNDTIHIALMKKVDKQFNISDKLRKEYPNLNIKITLINFETRGASETIYVILQNFTQDELSKKTIALDCDTIYFTDILQQFRSLDSTLNASFYFEDHTKCGIYSYIQFRDSESKTIINIVEKDPISIYANTGCYAFSSGTKLLYYCESILNQTVGSKGEYYTSSIIKEMISCKEYFKGIYVDSERGFRCVGTPIQLKSFLQEVKSGLFRPKQMRFSFDLDNTLVTTPQVIGDYTTVQPIQNMIQLVRDLYELGHHIIIYTARNMKTQRGNVGVVLKNVGSITFETLEKFNIPYHEIIFGKPYADVYIDDSSVNSLIDTFKEIGWISPPKNDQLFTPRSFNEVKEIKETYLKSSSSATFLGELYFYEHIPDDIKDMFPNVYDIKKDGIKRSIILEKIHGVTYTHLLVDKCLTKGRLLLLLQHLHRLHLSHGHPDDTLESKKRYIYYNYVPKLIKRYEQSRELYSKVDINSQDIYNRLLAGLNEYESNKQGLPSSVIHGDTVFSNILIDSQNHIVFIDMKGCLGDILTICGDITYDLAKVYQSLCGYDLIISSIDKRLIDSYTEYMIELRTIFSEFVNSFYPTVKMNNIKLITASLLFSLIPLHESHHKEFYDLCVSLLK